MSSLEIERKFFIRSDNDHLQSVLQGKIATVEERYYLYRENGIEIRFTKLTKEGSSYYNFDRMALQQSSEQDSHLVRSKERLRITEAEFYKLLSLAKLDHPLVQPIVRWSYHISDHPKMEIKVYKLNHTGLIRAEVEFDSEEQAVTFSPPGWFGEEITDSPIGIDTRLPDLSESEFRSILKSLQ